MTPQIVTVFVKAYHKALYDFVGAMVKGGPDASVLLRIAQWTKEYARTMEKQLDVPAELLRPALLDGKEQDLVEDYLKLIIRKLDEWTNNLMTTELADFERRADPPEQDADGMYGLQGAIIMFQSASAPRRPV